MSANSRLVKDGFAPVVFCRYITTAHYVAQHISERLGVTVQAVTGEVPAEERIRRTITPEDQLRLVDRYTAQLKEAQ